MHQNYFNSLAITSSNPVLFLTSSSVVSLAISVNTSLPYWFSKTANSVISLLTTPLPVRGKLHSFKILWLPLAVCSITTNTWLLLETKSIAPPIPLTNFPGIIQLAISQVEETYIAPKIVKSKCPPRMIPNEVELLKILEPGIIVMVS